MLRVHESTGSADESVTRVKGEFTACNFGLGLSLMLDTEQLRHHNAAEHWVSFTLILADKGVCCTILRLIVAD